METKMIVNPSLHVFVFEIQEAIFEGYEIDINYPPTTFGIAYEVGMIKKDKEAVDIDMSPAYFDSITKRPAGRPKKT